MKKQKYEHIWKTKQKNKQTEIMKIKLSNVIFWCCFSHETKTKQQDKKEQPKNKEGKNKEKTTRKKKQEK